MPPPMVGRAGFHCRPSAGNSTNRSPGSGGCPLFQPGHPRVGQLLLVTPEGDQEDIPLAGRSGRQCHLASAEVMGWSGNRLECRRGRDPRALEDRAEPELPHGAFGGDGLGAVLTDFGVTITGRCPTSCLAQLRRDAAVPDDDSRRAGQSREPRTRAASRPRGGCAGMPAGRRRAEPSEVDDRVKPARAAASPNASAVPTSLRRSPRRSASARGRRPPRSRREACRRWPGRVRHRGWSAGGVVAAGMACCRGNVGGRPRPGPGYGRLSTKPEAPPASAFTAATQYSRPR